MSRYWSKLVNELTPYVPGEQPALPNIIKIKSNESPCDPSPQSRREALHGPHELAIERWPHKSSPPLHAAHYIAGAFLG